MQAIMTFLGARLLTMTDEGMIEDGYLTITGEKITAFGPRQQYKPDPKETTITLDGFTILPGLIDSHCHLIHENAFPVTDEYIARSSIAGVHAARLALEQGVTSLRNVGCRHKGIFELRKAVQDGSIPGPRFQAAGMPLAGTGISKTWRSHSHDGPFEVLRGVRQNWELGAEWIKLSISDGRWRPTEGWRDTPLFSLSEIQAAVEEAHAKDMHVVCHVDGPLGAELAATAGVDSIEHGVHILDDVLQEMASKGITFVPTVWIYSTQDLKVFDADLAFLNQLHADTIARAKAAGVRIAAGVDFSYLACPPLEGLVNELEALHGRGLSALETLQAATIHGAQLLGWEEQLGSIGAGKLADLIVVEKNPLEDLQHLHDLRMVIQNGRIVWDKAGEHAAQESATLPQLSPSWMSSTGEDLSP